MDNSLGTWIDGLSPNRPAPQPDPIQPIEEWIDEHVPKELNQRDHKRCLRECIRKAEKLEGKNYPREFIEKEVKRIISNWEMAIVITKRGITASKIYTCTICRGSRKDRDNPDEKCPRCNGAGVLAKQQYRGTQGVKRNWKGAK